LDIKHNPICPDSQENRSWLHLSCLKFPWNLWIEVLIVQNGQY